ncbi:MAG: TonB-dependent receptor [Acidobacteria bacterium]|nr:TonB-dependent receptor [Acidobacteriota bacterium]
MPGVTVTVRSDALQGARTSVTDLNGNYEIIGLPPGQYTASFALQGFTTVDDRVAVPLGGVATVNVRMLVGTVAEAIQVTAQVPTPLTTTETSQNIISEQIEQLPLGRTLFRIAELAPGLTANTPNNGQIAINGSFAFDNIYLIDGVDINDNLFGSANNLFIEDAVEEMQVLTSGISAEYGRFSGGVVNVITKSGGNRFSGSFRANLYTPDWTARTPFEKENDNERTGDIAENATYETTVGGPIVQDRLWFFYANRREQQSSDETFPESGISYVRGLENDRNLVKLTGTLAPGHTLAGSYMRNSTAQDRPTFLSFSIDPATLISRTTPNDLWVATYRGAVSSRLFIEGQVSRRQFGFRGGGGTSTNILDSPFITVTQGLGHFNAPYFDSSDPEDRNNRQVTASATYFLPTNAGTHSIKGGFEHFRTTNIGGNSQTSTGKVFITEYAETAQGAPLLDANGRFVPVFGAPAPFTIMQTWLPVKGAVLDINTMSFYVNDNWVVSDHVSVNLGIRAETVNSDATGGIVGVDTSAVVPRLAIALDPLGDGRYTFQATYSHYTGKYSASQFANNTNVGNPNSLDAIYVGPAGQGLDFAPGFDPANYVTIAGDFPIQNVFFDNDLKSPRTKEFTVSAGGALGSRGYAKLTYINRRASDFVEDFVTLAGGSTTIMGDAGEDFGTFSNIIWRNTDALERNYDGLEFQGRFQVADNFLIDGSYTAQLKNEGNYEGEATNQPGLTSAAFDYPEVTPADRFFPLGRLDDFQRHKLRVWGIYNLEIGSAGVVDIGGIWRYNSGLAYSIRTDITATATQTAILADLGYVDGPSRRAVYFKGRGTETFDGYGLFDLSVSYRIPVWDSLSPWIKFDLFNAFNNNKQIASNVAVSTDPDSPVDELGIPTGFIEGTRFGEATSVDHFPQYIANLDGLRSFLMSFGLRF